MGKGNLKNLLLITIVALIFGCWFCMPLSMPCMLSVCKLPLSF